MRWFTSHLGSPWSLLSKTLLACWYQNWLSEKIQGMLITWLHEKRLLKGAKLRNIKYRIEFSFAPHAPHFKTSNAQTVKIRELTFWENVHPPRCVTCQVSAVNCHMTGVTFLVSAVTYKKKVGASWLRICYQWDLLCLVLMNATLCEWVKNQFKFKWSEFF